MVGEKENKAPQPRLPEDIIKEITGIKDAGDIQTKLGDVVTDFNLAETAKQRKKALGRLREIRKREGVGPKTKARIGELQEALTAQHTERRSAAPRLEVDQSLTRVVPEPAPEAAPSPEKSPSEPGKPGKLTNWYLNDLKALRETAERTDNQNLMEKVRADVQAELEDKAQPFLAEKQPLVQELGYARTRVQETQGEDEKTGERLAVIEKKLKDPQKELSRGDQRRLAKEKQALTKTRESLRENIAQEEQKITRLQEEVDSLNQKANPYIEVLNSYNGEEEKALDEYPRLFFREEEGPRTEVEVRRLEGGRVEAKGRGVQGVDMMEFEALLGKGGPGRKGPMHYEFENMNEAQTELRQFLNEAVRSYTIIRPGVHHWSGRLIVEAMREFAEVAIETGAPQEAEKAKEIYAAAAWEFDCVKRVLDYWLKACDTEQLSEHGMGLSFGQAIQYGRRLSGAHQKWLWQSDRGPGIKKAMGQKFPDLDPARPQAMFAQLRDEGYGNLKDADVNYMLGAMLRLGGGMGIYDGSRSMVFRLPGSKGVVYFEGNPDHPWKDARALTEKTSPFLYEVMKNTLDYYLRYTESRHELFSLFLEPTGRYTSDGQPIYRCWLSNELTGFVTAYQMLGLEKFYFDNLDHLRDERKRELGWDPGKTNEENRRALAMFNEEELLTRAEANKWQVMIRRDDAEVNVWDAAKSIEDNLAVLAALPIEELMQLPSAYWLMTKNLMSLRAWEIDNWQEFDFAKYPDSSVFCGWAQYMKYLQDSRNAIIGILRGERNILELVDQLETRFMCQIPEVLAYKKHNFLDFLKDSITYMSFMPSFWRRRRNGEGMSLTIELKQMLGTDIFMGGWRKKVRLLGCGAREATYRLRSGFPDWLLGRMALQFVSEKAIWQGFLAEQGVSFDDFVHWCGIKGYELHEDARSFDGDLFHWCEFNEEMTPEEWQRWKLEHPVESGRIGTMIRSLPMAGLWEAMDSAVEYQIAEAIVRSYAESAVDQRHARKPLQKRLMRLFYRLGIPQHRAEVEILAMKYLRRQVCGMDFREEEERKPLVDGQRPLDDILIGRPWHSQMLGLRDAWVWEEVAGRRVKRHVKHWVPPVRSRHVPYIYSTYAFKEGDIQTLFDLLTIQEFELLPQKGVELNAGQVIFVTDVNRLKTMMKLSSRVRREALATEAARIGGRFPDELTLNLLEQLAEFAATDSIERKIELRETIVEQETKRKMGLDPVFDLIYTTMEGAWQSVEEYSPRRPFHDTTLWFDSEFTRLGPQLIYQHVGNEVAYINTMAELGKEEKTNIDGYCEEFSVQKRIYNPLMIWLTLKATRIAGWIDENEFTALCRRYEVNKNVAVSYYKELAALGFEHDLQAKLVAQREDVEGQAVGAAIGEVMVAAKMGFFKRILFNVKAPSETARFLRNCGWPTAASVLWPIILLRFGGPAVSFGAHLSSIFLASGGSAIVAQQAGKGENTTGVGRWLSMRLGMAGERRKRSRIDNLARGYCQVTGFPVIKWLPVLIRATIGRPFGMNPVQLAIHPCTQIQVDSRVRDFAESKSQLGGGGKSEH